MAIKLELSPRETKDTIANHGAQTSGNAVFLSVPSVKPVKKSTDITDIAKDIRELDISHLTVDSETLAKLVSGGLELIERYRIATPSPPSVRTDVRVLIDRETDKLDVLSECIGPALLSVLNIHGPLSTSQMLESLDITNEVLISHLETLQRNGLVTSIGTLEEGICYSISEEGIEFLRSLGLEEENR